MSVAGKDNGNRISGRGKVNGIGEGLGRGIERTGEQ